MKTVTSGNDGNLEPVRPLFAASARPYGANAAGRPIPYLRILLHRRKTLALFALAGLVLGILAVRQMPYIYQARSVLEVQGLNENLLNRQELDPGARPDNSSQSYVNTQAKLIESTQLYDRVAERLNHPDAAAAQTGRPWNPPVTRREIAAAVRVQTHDTDRIIDIVSESQDPRRAAAIANTLTNEFVKQDLESRWREGKNTSEWLARDLSDLAAKLHASEEELQAYTQRQNLLMDDGEGNVAETRLRAVQAQLARAEEDRIVKETLYENARNAHDGDPANATADQYEVQITALQKQLAEMEATYAPGYYKIAPLKAQIASMQKALTQQRHTALERMGNEYQAAVQREKMLRSSYNAQMRDAADESAKMVRFNDLKKAVEMNRQIYAEMLQKVKGYNIGSDIQASNVRIVDPAEVPRKPKRPNKPMLAFLWAFGFFCVGVCWSVARAASNQTITEPGDTLHYLRSRELGVIPAAAADPLARRAGMAATGFMNGGRHANPGIETITWKCAPSLMAESFRSTSASLLLPWQDDPGKRVFLITSMSPAEGKTTVASNIAIAMAGAAGRVLLIDADRRRPRLHAIFERSNKTGLSEFLHSDLPVGSIHQSIVSTPVSNLSLLPNGTAMLDRPDMLYSVRMATLIAYLREQFDVVVIDTPPLMHLPDARIIGRLCDGAILVLRAGHVRWDSAMAAERRLTDDGIPILGTVLNDWSPAKDGYGVYPNTKSIYAYIGS